MFTRHVRGYEPQRVAERAPWACQEGVVRTVEGQDLAIEFDSICLHSDTPVRPTWSRPPGAALDAAGIEVRAPR